MKYLLTALLGFTLISVGRGQVNNSIDFDGNNDFIQTTSPGVLGSTNRTFEAWIKPDANITSNNCIMDYGRNAVGSRNTFNINGNYGLGFISGGTNANMGTSANAVTAGVWTHVAFVLDNGTGKIYVNGVLQATGNLSSVNTPSGYTNVKIGQRVPGGSIPFHGKIDEVRIWNVARTAAQLQANMNNRLCTMPSSLVAYYTFDDGIASGNNAGVGTLYDFSGNDDHGTLNNISKSGSNSNWVTGAPTSGGILKYITFDTACTSYQWAQNGMIYTTGGKKKDTSVNTNGCNEYHELRLNILGGDTVAQTINACQVYTWGVNGSTYTSSGVYSESFTNQNGCDSTRVLNLTIHQPTSVTVSETSCDSYTYNGTTYSQSGTYLDTLTGAGGCDSVITLNLTINNSVTNTITETACQSYFWTANGQTYTSSGTHTETLGTSTGCDSVVTLNLTIINEYNTSETVETCFEYTWPVNGTTYTSSGTYNETLTSVIGCDSNITLDLTITNIDNSISITNQNILISNELNATYRWLDCDNNYAAIPGENSVSFDPSTSGTYAVELTKGACKDTSDCQYVELTGVQEVYQGEFVSIFPNPSNGIVTIKTSEGAQLRAIRIYSITGKMIREDNVEGQQSNLALPPASGVYFIHVETTSGLSVKRIQRL